MTSRGKTAAKLEHLSESWIREMTRIALECGAINLSQGYPDFDPPREVREAAAKAVLRTVTNLMASLDCTVAMALPA